MKIFISYAREDITIAQQFEQHLIRSGFQVWRDDRIEANWSREIALNLVQIPDLINNMYMYIIITQIWFI
jgi:TIR domain